MPNCTEVKTILNLFVPSWSPTLFLIELLGEIDLMIRPGTNPDMIEIKKANKKTIATGVSDNIEVPDVDFPSKLNKWFSNK